MLLRFPYVMQRSKDRYVGVWVRPRHGNATECVGRDPGHNLDVIASEIARLLELESADIVLDVCCGNGLLTRRIAQYSGVVHGVDFSEVNLELAIKKNRAGNVTYHLADVLVLDTVFSARMFTKVYCYFSFQYFDRTQGVHLIEMLSKITRVGGLILLGDIPDRTRRANYYDSPGRRLRYLAKRAIWTLLRRPGEESLGWWWDPEWIRVACSRLDLQCQVLPQSPQLPNSHYRFDSLIRNTGSKRI